MSKSRAGWGAGNNSDHWLSPKQQGFLLQKMNFYLAEQATTHSMFFLPQFLVPSFCVVTETTTSHESEGLFQGFLDIHVVLWHYAHSQLFWKTILSSSERPHCGHCPGVYVSCSGASNSCQIFLFCGSCNHFAASFQKKQGFYSFLFQGPKLE